MTLLSRRTFLNASVAVCTATGLRLRQWTGAPGPVEGGAAGTLLLGVDYYPDQTPENLWEVDARMIAAAGFTNVRIA